MSEPSPEIPTPPPITALVGQDVGRFLGLARDDNNDTAHHAARVVFDLLHGQLRGQVPSPLPRDLDGVLRAATTRYAAMVVRLLRSQPQDNDSSGPGDFPPFMGFLLHERLIIDRYRRTTA